MSFTWHGSSLLNQMFLISQILNHRYSRRNTSPMFMLGLRSIFTCNQQRKYCYSGIDSVCLIVTGSLSPHVMRRQPVSDKHYFLGLLAPYLERACFLLATPAVSRVPLTIWYLVPGRSFTLPPRISTTLCSCRLCPSPGI